jgi:hypothetical protein
MSEFQHITVGEREEFLGFFYIGTYDNQAVAVLPERKNINEFTEFAE